MHELNDSVKFFKAKVSQPYSPRTPISLYHCTAEIRQFKCHEKFFGQTSKHYSRSTNCCIKASLYYSRNTQHFPNRYINRGLSYSMDNHRNHDHYSCSWLKTKVNHFTHFTATSYPGIIADDSFIHQSVTHTPCYYRNFSCIPTEFLESIIVWFNVSHSFRRFRPLGTYEIHRLSDFILIPKLGFGGTIQNEDPPHKFFQLDNGVLLLLPKETDYGYSKFLQAAKTFLSQAKPSLQTGLLQAHIEVVLEMHRKNMINTWDQLCKDHNRLLQFQHWMIRNFPDSSVNWVIDNPGYFIEVIGDAILLSKCKVITRYELFWNRSLSELCFKEIPVRIWDTNTTKLLQLVNRRIQLHGTVLNCSTRPNSTFLTDINGQLWHLSANGTYELFPLKQLFSHVKSLDFTLVKLRGLNSNFVRPKRHQLDRSSLLDLVSANHVSLQEIYQISGTGHGSFLNGLGKLLGVTINSLAKGGTKIITAVGHGLKQGFEGLGSFTHDAITAAGNATGTVLESTGHAIKDTTTGMGSFFE